MIGLDAFTEYMPLTYDVLLPHEFSEVAGPHPGGERRFSLKPCGAGMLKEVGAFSLLFHYEIGKITAR